MDFFFVCVNQIDMDFHHRPHQHQHPWALRPSPDVCINQPGFNRQGERWAFTYMCLQTSDDFVAGKLSLYSGTLCYRVAFASLIPRTTT
jgi:hypothetical protein